MTVALIAVVAVLIDWQLGEPRRLHPLIGFGHLATWVECRFYGGPGLSAARRRLRGTLAVGLLLTPAVALAMAITRLPYVSDTVAAVLPGGCGLFQWVVTLEANAIHELLAREGILTRLFHDPPSLRFGLPGTEQGWMRLEAALAVPCTGASSR